VKEEQHVEKCGRMNRLAPGVKEEQHVGMWKDEQVGTGHHLFAGYQRVAGYEVRM
jgi:hypothetical protein